MPTDKGSNTGRKIGSLVTGMVAGADSITDMALLRHGAMGTVVDRPYAPSTLGSFLRESTFGHVRQLDAVASRFLGALAARAPVVAGIGTGRVLVDIDDSIIEVHGHGKRGCVERSARILGLGGPTGRGRNPALRTDLTDMSSRSTDISGDRTTCRAVVCCPVPVPGQATDEYAEMTKCCRLNRSSPA